MEHFWCKFENHKPATINAKDVVEMADVAKQHGLTIISLAVIPYPADPEINPGTCPTFCFQPDACSGHTSCPRRYACSE